MSLVFTYAYTIEHSPTILQEGFVHIVEQGVYQADPQKELEDILEVLSEVTVKKGKDAD